MPYSTRPQPSRASACIRRDAGQTVSMLWSISFFVQEGRRREQYVATLYDVGQGQASMLASGFASTPKEAVRLAEIDLEDRYARARRAILDWKLEHDGAIDQSTTKALPVAAGYSGEADGVLEAAPTPTG